MNIAKNLSVSNNNFCSLSGFLLGGFDHSEVQISSMGPTKGQKQCTLLCSFQDD